MRRLLPLALLLILFPVLGADPAALGRLVAGLSSPDWQERDRAEAALEAAGLEAEAALSEAAKSPDEEVAWRCRKLLSRIRRTRLTVALQLPDGTPARDLAVSLNLVPLSGGVSTPLEGRTDAEGRLGFPDRPLEPGEYMVQGGCGTFLPIRFEPLRLQGGPRTLALRLETGARVSGVLRFRDGKPADGVAVGLHPCLEAAQIHRYADIARKREVVADAEGRFAFDPVPEGEYRILAEAEVPGGRAEILLERRRILHEGETVRDLVLELPDDPARETAFLRDAILTGRCVDAAGKPRTGHLRFFLDGIAGWPEHSGEAKTDAAGRFAAVVPPGRHWLSAQLDGTAPATVGPLALKPGLNEPVTLVLGAGALIQGTVTGPDGTPVPDAEIGHYHPGRLESGTPETSITHQIPFADKLGKFRIPAAMPGTWEIRATGEGMGLGAVQRIEVKEGETREVRLQVPAGILVRGRVEAVNGEPCEKAVLWAFSEAWENHAGDPWEPYAYARAESRGEGRFEMVLPFPGTWWIAAEQDGFSPASVSVEAKAPGQELAARIRMERALAGSIRIVAKDGRGAPLPGARAWILSLHPLRAPALADAAGEIRLEGLPPGSYSLAVTKPDLAPCLLRVDVASREESRADALLDRGGSISGRLLDASGKGIPGRAVWAWRAEFSLRHVEEQFGTSAWEALTDAEGRFRFDRLPPGRVKLSPAPGAEAAEIWTGSVPAEGKALDGVELSLGPGVPLRVRVTDAAGKPVANASVEAYPAGTLTDPYSIDLYAVVFTREDGTAELPPLPPGVRVDLLVAHTEKPWLFRKGVEIPAKEAPPLDLALQKGARLEGKLKVLPPAVFGQALREDVFVLALGPGAGKTRVRGDGSFAFENLAPGDYEVFLTVGNRRMAGMPASVPGTCELPVARPLPALQY